MDSASKIRINQIGYALSLPQQVTILTDAPLTVRDESGTELYRFDALTPQRDEASGDQTVARTLHLSVPGIYVLEAGGERRKIMVGAEPWRDVTNALIKGLYYQRCGCELEPVHAGSYAHPAAMGLCSGDESP